MSELIPNTGWSQLKDNVKADVSDTELNDDTYTGTQDEEESKNDTGLINDDSLDGLYDDILSSHLSLAPTTLNQESLSKTISSSSTGRLSPLRAKSTKSDLAEVVKSNSITTDLEVNKNKFLNQCLIYLYMKGREFTVHMNKGFNKRTLDSKKPLLAVFITILIIVSIIIIL